MSEMVLLAGVHEHTSSTRVASEIAVLLSVRGNLGTYQPGEAREGAEQCRNERLEEAARVIVAEMREGAGRSANKYKALWFARGHGGGE